MTSYRNYLYEIVCRDDKGWGAEPDGLWGDYVDRASRIFATEAEAREICDELLGACWETYDDEGFVRDESIPEFAVEKLAVHEACWIDADDDEGAINRIVELHGRDIRFSDMPLDVAEFLLAKYGGAGAAWRQESASLAGASSDTYTATFIGAGFASRVAAIREMLAKREEAQ